MRIAKNIIKWLLGILIVLYVGVCLIIYFNQEKGIFPLKKLPANFTFDFPGTFEERNIKARDGIILNGLLFKADSSKGLIFYLHGNGGALDSWGKIAPIYTEHHYDVYILDYRGYGKSEGKITNEAQFHDDVQICYNDLKNSYPENKIVVLGYSIGTAPATTLAVHNHPKMLILQAPCISGIDLMKKTLPFLPSFLWRYKFEVKAYLEKVTAPVVIFHGDADRTIYYGSSVRLSEHLKPGDKFITLKGQGHNAYGPNSKDYIEAIGSVLQ